MSAPIEIDGPHYPRRRLRTDAVVWAGVVACCVAATVFLSVFPH